MSTLKSCQVPLTSADTRGWVMCSCRAAAASVNCSVASRAMHWIRSTTPVWTLGLLLNASGRHAQAQALLQKSPTARTGEYTSLVLAENLVLAGKSADVAAALKSASARMQLIGTALAEYSLGHLDASTRALDDLQQSYASGSVFQIAEIYAWRGEKDQAFQWLQRAYEQHDGGMSMIKYSPFLISLRGDPRYAAMVKKMGLPQ